MMRHGRWKSPSTSIGDCDPSGREAHAVLADLEGALLASSHPFPYFLLLAVEAGSLLRGFLLLLVSPFSLFLHAFVSQSLAIQLLVFVSVAGVHIHDIHKVARVVLPRFYADDVRASTWKVFNSCGGRRVVLTTSPAVMAASFVREYLGGDEVIGPELQVDPMTGKATGFVMGPDVLDGLRKSAAAESPELGLWGAESGQHFWDFCKENYVADPDSTTGKASPGSLNATTIFHDGRFVHRPDPLTALQLFLWIPLGAPISLLRIAIFLSLPPRLARLALRLSGVRIVVRGKLPPPVSTTSRLLVLNHRNNLDPIFVCLALGRRLPCVTYRLNRLFRLLSPITTFALSRERDADAARISALLERGDLLMCPEGTTSREPYLLRFSALFAEMTDDIVPVAVNTKEAMFHGTTFHGSKIMDPLFFFMNPRPTYEITFLDLLQEKHACCRSGRTRIDVANYVQLVLGRELGFKCTMLARKDKYMKLGGDGWAAGAPLFAPKE